MTLANKYFRMFVNEAPGANHQNSIEDKAADLFAGFAGEHETTRAAFIEDGLNYLDTFPDYGEGQISGLNFDDAGDDEDAYEAYAAHNELVAAIRYLIVESMKVDRGEFVKLLEEDWHERYETADD